jgi:ligand-binding SRPBCC domain-containing protein
MPIINLSTTINAPIEICFDLSRSIELHQLSTARSNERAVAGVTSGLIGLNEEVTWEATHFGIRQTLSSKITAFQFPTYFRDEMVRGIFKMLRHDHRFERKGDVTIMSDAFEFESPAGLFGNLVNKVGLTDYLRNLLLERNRVIKEFAETQRWKDILLKKIKDHSKNQQKYTGF